MPDRDMYSDVRLLPPPNPAPPVPSATREAFLDYLPTRLPTYLHILYQPVLPYPVILSYG